MVTEAHSGTQTRKLMQKLEEIKQRARTGDIIGNGGGNVDPRWQKYFDRLVETREALISRRGSLSETGTVDESKFAANPADRGTDEYDVAANYGQLSSDQETLVEIDQALHRIEDGTYGTCEVTGEPIPEDRLDAVPWARFARDAEEDLEREAQSRKARHIL